MYRRVFESYIHTTHDSARAEGVHALLLEARARRAVCARPPQGAAEQRVGAPRAGGADQHAAALREDDLGVDVRGGDDVGGAERGDQHLQHVQAHLAEAAAQLHQVLLRDLQAGPAGGRLQGAAAEHGGDRAARARRHARPAGRELVPEQGGPRSVLQKSALCRANSLLSLCASRLLACAGQWCASRAAISSATASARRRRRPP